VGIQVAAVIAQVFQMLSIGIASGRIPDPVKAKSETRVWRKACFEAYLIRSKDWMPWEVAAFDEQSLPEAVAVCT
jgi:hypothetical protein